MVVPPMFDKTMNAVVRTAPYAPSERAAALHKTLFVSDLHADSLLWNRNLLVENGRGHVDLPRLAKGNVALQAFTIVTKTPKNMNFESNAGDTDNITTLAIMQRWPRRTYSSLLERALYQAQKLHDLESFSNGTFMVIESKRDLEALLALRRSRPEAVGGLLGIEGAHCLEGRLENIDTLHAAGIRMIGITHFFDNELGGSAHGIQKGGLTEFGRACVKKFEEKKILVDLAHASPAVIDDVLAMATRPVVFSHGGVKGTCDRTRNLSDDHLRGIAATGGIVGIAFFDEAICGADAAAVVAAIRYAASVIGYDHVALGSDFDGVITAPFDAAQLADITEELLKQNVAEDDIRKVMGENVRRLLEKELPDV